MSEPVPTFDQVRPNTIIDIAITAVLIYWLFSLIRGTRAVRLVLGISVLFALYVVARWLDLRRNYLRYIAALNWINVPLILVALVVTGAGELAPPLFPALNIGLELLLFIWFCAATRLVLGAAWGLTLGLFLISIASSIILQMAVQGVLGLSRA